MTFELKIESGDEYSRDQAIWTCRNCGRVFITDADADAPCDCPCEYEEERR